MSVFCSSVTVIVTSQHCHVISAEEVLGLPCDDRAWISRVHGYCCCFSFSPNVFWCGVNTIMRHVELKSICNSAVAV